MSLKASNFTKPEQALLDELDRLIDYTQGADGVVRVSHITLDEKQWKVWLSIKTRALENRLARGKLDPMFDQYRKVTIVCAPPVNA